MKDIDRITHESGGAVLLLSHGGPADLSEIPGFLQALSGRAPSAETIARVAERYRRIGGGSPAPRLAESLAAKLAPVCGLPVYSAMLHWHPLIEEVVPRMAAQAVLRIFAVCLVPHYSEAGVGKYHARVAAAAASAGVEVRLLESWHAEPGFVAAIEESLVTLVPEATASGMREATGPWPHVIFTAHSLPPAAVRADDRYQAQLAETAELVAGRLGLAAAGWTLAYQGATGSGEGWLGPSVGQVLLELSARGVGRVVVSPIGFVLDQVETLYDLDIALKAQARELGIDLVRARAPNDSDALVKTLAGLVRRLQAGNE